jgi:hypothetical protein
VLTVGTVKTQNVILLLRNYCCGLTHIKFQLFIFTIFNIQIIHFQEGAFALCLMSRHFPGECVATR